MLMTAGAVRHIYPGERREDGFQPSFAAALATPSGSSRRPPRSCSTIACPRRCARDSHFSAQTLQALPAEWFAGRVVLLGADLPNQDTFRTPLSVAQSGAAMAGIFIHAQALAQIFDGAQFPAVLGWIEAAIVVLTAALGVVLPFVPLRAYWKGAIGLGVIGAYWSFGFAYFASGGALLPLLSPTLSLVLAVAFGITYARRRDQLEKGLIRSAFGRYVSPQIIEQCSGIRASSRSAARSAK